VGEYSYQVTDGGCQESGNFSILEPNKPGLNILSSGNIDCNNLSTTLQGQATGNALAYSWSTIDGSIDGNANQANINVIAAGTYVLTVTDGSTNCSVTDSITISENTNTPNINIAPPGEITCNVTRVELLGSSSTPGVSYFWETSDGFIESGENTVNPTVSAAGTYTLTITITATGCTSSQNVIVNANNQIPDITFNTPGLISCNNTEVALIASSSDQNASFIWSTTDGNIIGSANEDTISVSAAGTYQVTVFNSSTGCLNTSSLVVSADTTQPDISIDIPAEITCTNAEITIQGGSTTSGVIYSWSTSDGQMEGNTDQSALTVSAAGTYTLTVTDLSNGCTATQNVTVTENTNLPDIAIDAASVEINCLNTSLELAGSSATNGVTFNWSTNDGVISTTSNKDTISVTAAGTYTLTVTDPASGCVSTQSIVISANSTTPDISISDPATLTCAAPITSITGSSTDPNVTFAWTTTNGNIIGNANQATIQVSQGGTYLLTITDINSGCFASQSVVVNEDKTAPGVNVLSSGNLDCNNASISLIGSSPASEVTFSWSTTNGNIISDSSQATISVDAAGTYILTVTSTVNGCDSKMNFVVNDLSALPNLSIEAPGVVNCFNSSINLQASSTTPNVTYKWTTTNGNIDSGDETATPLISEPGTYTLAITNPATGCVATQNVVVNGSKTLPDLNPGSSGDITCNNASVTLDVTSSQANLTYLWTTLDGNIATDNTQPSIQVNQAGTYTITAVNPVTGCTNSEDIVVNENLLDPQVTINGSTEINCNNPSLSLTASSANQGLTYSWSTADGNFVGATVQETVQVDAAGTYIVLVIDPVNGCTDADTVVVTEDITTPNLVIEAPRTTITCAQPSIQITGSSTTPGVTFLWTTSDGTISTASDQAIITVTSGGMYTLTVTNPQTGCTNVQDIIINETSEVDLSLSVEGEITCINPTVTITGTSTTSGLVYVWTTIDGTIDTQVFGTNEATVSAAGFYTLTAIDPISGCSVSKSVFISENTEQPDLQIATPSDITCNNPLISLIGSSATSGVTYSWSSENGEIIGEPTQASVQVNSAGTYVLTVTNPVNGCVSVDSVTVNAFTEVTVSLDLSNDIDCNNTTAQITSSSSSANLSYLWTSLDGNITSDNTLSSITVDRAGTYTLNVVDNVTGCTDSSQVVVSANLEAPQINFEPTTDITCNTPTIDLTALVTGENLSLLWTTNDGVISSDSTLSTITVTTAGTYTLTALNPVTGCETSQSLTVTADTSLPEISIADADTLTCSVLSINLTGSSTSPNTVFNWTSNDGQILGRSDTAVIQVSALGTYTLTVRDTLTGCETSQSVAVFEDTTPPVAEILAADTITCAQPTVVLNSRVTDANLIYSWTTDDGVIEGRTDSSSVVASAAGSYMLTVSNGFNRCFAKDTVVVLGNTVEPTASIL
ncbi:MAG: hypothetical protein AAFU64_00655, partial [Bacteroidota bacterium]